MKNGEESAMPMLAERRQKVRYILNPRHTPWTNDDSRFGLKYMEKLGWKTGQGIGTNLQGLTDCIKVSVKSDCRGLGFKGIPEDLLIHQDNYSNLLAQLATNTTPAKTETEEKDKSLELKSRQSRSRVHYSKFTRSKDVSRYSGNDLSCILGKPAKASESYVDDNVPNEPSFIQRGNMYSYFRENMKANCVDFDAAAETNKLIGERNPYMGFGFNQVNNYVPLSHVSPSYPDSETIDDQQGLNGCRTNSRKSHKINNQIIQECEIDFIPQVDNIVSGQPMTGVELSESSKKLTRNWKKNGIPVAADFPENSYSVSYSSEIVNPADNEEERNTILKIKQKMNYQCVDMPASEGLLPLTDCSESVFIIETEGESNKNIMNSKRKHKNDGQCLVVSTYKTEEESNENIRKSKKKRKKDGRCSESFLPITDCNVTVLAYKTEEESNENIKNSKKKRKKETRKCLKVPVSESCLPSTDCNEMALSYDTLEESNENIRRSKKKQKKNDQCLEVLVSESCFPSTDCNEMALSYDTREESNENIRKSKKKRKKNDQYVEVLVSEGCLPSTDCNGMALSYDTREESNENIRKSKKKRKKNDQYVEVLVASESCLLPTADCNEMALAYKSREESNENLRKSKKKRKKNDQYVEVLASESCLPTANCNEMALAYKTEEESNENIKKSKQKHKKNDMYLEVHTSKTAIAMKTEEKFNENIKRKKKKHNNNDQCLEVPAGESCLPITDCCETELSPTYKVEVESNEGIMNSKKKKKRNDRQKSCEGCEPEILIYHSVESPSPENPSPKTVGLCSPGPMIEVGGIRYINGISDSNKYLQRRLEYSAGANKSIEKTLREEAMDAFDQFPGSNITLLPGYADMLNNTM